jgi:hypothetical protein
MRKLLTIGAVLLAIGCGDSTAPAGSVAGTWNLRTVNGFSIPFASNGVELTSDVITASASGTFTQMTVVKKTQGGQVTIDSIPDAGTYTISGHSVTFDFTSASPSGTGILDGNTLTVTTDITLVYRRQE